MPDRWRKNSNALHGDIKGVISIGLGGGLSPLAQSGRGGDRRSGHRGRGSFSLRRALARIALAAKLPGAHQGPVAASDVILENADGKAALFAKTGALAVDMESAVAARFAANAETALRGAAGDFR